MLWNCGLCQRAHAVRFKKSLYLHWRGSKLLWKAPTKGNRQRGQYIDAAFVGNGIIRLQSFTWVANISGAICGRGQDCAFLHDSVTWVALCVPVNRQKIHLTTPSISIKSSWRPQFLWMISCLFGVSCLFWLRKSDRDSPLEPVAESAIEASVNWGYVSVFIKLTSTSGTTCLTWGITLI